MNDKKQLHFQTLGNAGNPVLIFLHGFLGSANNWRSFAKQFETTHQIFLIDFRNHGLSFHSDQMNYEVLSQDIFDFCIDNTLNEVNIVGHSMGGKILFKMLADQNLYSIPQIKKAIVLDIGFWPQEVYQNDQIITLLHTLNLKEYQSRTEIEKDLTKKLQTNQLGNLNMARFLLKNITTQDQTLVWRSNIPILQKTRKFLHQGIFFENKTHIQPVVIRGEKSNFIPQEKIEHITKVFPNSTVETIKNAGHWLHVDAFVDLTKLIKNHLSV